MLLFTIYPCRKVEAGSKPDFPKGVKGVLVFIVYILKFDAISFGSFINSTISPLPWTVKTFKFDNKEDIVQFPGSF